MQSMNFRYDMEETFGEFTATNSVCFVLNSLLLRSWNYEPLKLSSRIAFLV